MTIPCTRIGANRSPGRCLTCMCRHMSYFHKTEREGEIFLGENDLKVILVLLWCPLQEDFSGKKLVEREIFGFHLRSLRPPNRRDKKRPQTRGTQYITHAEDNRNNITRLSTCYPVPFDTPGKDSLICRTRTVRVKAYSAACKPCIIPRHPPVQVGLQDFQVHLTDEPMPKTSITLLANCRR